ncbi:MAG: rod-binding protein [Alphaproteobacteria bacterium]|nr:rod-binding protein [Alphaproteobacteria bacterium]
MTEAVQLLGDVSVQNAMASRFSSRAVTAKDAAAAEAAAKDFEAMFMAQMLQPMWEGVGDDNVLGGGHGEEMMRGFLTQEYGKAMVQGSHSGLSDALKREIIRLQSDKQSGAAS